MPNVDAMKNSGFKGTNLSMVLTTLIELYDFLEKNNIELNKKNLMKVMEEGHEGGGYPISRRFLLPLLQQTFGVRALQKIQKSRKNDKIGFFTTVLKFRNIILEGQLNEMNLINSINLANWHNAAIFYSMC